METTMEHGQLETSEYADYYQPYIGLVTETDVLVAMKQQVDDLIAALGHLPDDEANKLHAPYTWTIKQVIGHCLDNERIFGYRALRFAAGDTTDLPGYDQDQFVANADYTRCSLAELLGEFESLRSANLAMFRRFAPETWNLQGRADGNLLSVRAIAYLQVGHLRHHLQIVKQRIA